MPKNKSKRNHYAERRRPDKPEPNETAQRLRIEPAFLDYYNELVRPHVELRVPAYIWNWKPVLSSGAFVTYLRLRSMCFYDLKNAANTRDWCWPKQGTLAQELNMGERSLRRYFEELESYQLIYRKANYEYDPVIKKRKRVEDTYVVPWEVPLLPQDLEKYSQHYAEKLIDETLQTPQIREDRPTGKIGHQVEQSPDPTTYRPKWPVGDSNPGPTGQNGQFLSPAKMAEQESVPRTYTTNVGQRLRNPSKGKRPGQSSLFDNPQVQALDEAGLARKERLADEIGRTLKKLDGQRDLEPHPWAGYHFRVACLMPEEEIHSALTDTHDAVSMGKAKNASKYFTGIVKNKARDLGVDLGLKSGAEGPSEG